MQNNKIIIFDFDGVIVNTEIPTKPMYDLIKVLSDEYQLAICSSSGSGYISSVLLKEKINHCFDDIMSVDIFSRKSTKMKNLLEMYEIPNTDSVFITDTLSDIKEASKINIKTIGVTWGIDPKSVLKEGFPLAVVDTVSELEAEIKKYFAGLS